MLRDKATACMGVDKKAHHYVVWQIAALPGKHHTVGIRFRHILARAPPLDEESFLCRVPLHTLLTRVRPLTGKRQTIVSLSSVSLQSANAAAAFLWEGVRCVGLLYLRSNPVLEVVAVSPRAATPPSRKGCCIFAQPPRGCCISGQQLCPLGEGGHHPSTAMGAS